MKSPASSGCRADVRAAIAVGALCVVALSGCGRPQAPATNGQWVLGTDLPAFDPDGPPDPVRAALERLLTRGLVEEDSSGRPVPGIADSIVASDDSLRWTFRLAPGLQFTDGTPCGSADLRRALTQGLGRADHSTRSWELAAVRGVRDVRVGQALPVLGIDTPDDRTLILRLAVPDPALLQKLARPGVGRAWRQREGSWHSAIGLGPYRVARQDSTRSLELVRPKREAAAGPDTLTLRFAPVTARVRSLLRAGRPDLVWPLPPGLLNEPLPDGYRAATREARPARWMVLALRADSPPATRMAARQALAHGINQQDVQRALGLQIEPISDFIPGAGPFDSPRLDPAEIELWRERGKFTRSFHVDLVFDGHGPPNSIARTLQGEWARHDIYAEVIPRWGKRLEQERLTGRPQLALAVHQDLLATPGGAIAAWVMPLRGPAVGDVRTGWRTREFDGWIDPPGRSAPSPGQIQRRIEQERIVLPLARMPWDWVEREGGNDVPPFHPRYGPTCPDPGPGAQAR